MQSAGGAGTVAAGCSPPTLSDLCQPVSIPWACIETTVCWLASTRTGARIIGGHGPLHRPPAPSVPAPAHLRSLFFHKEMELSLIGLQNAGKTSLVNVLTTGQFHEDMIPTVGAALLGRVPAALAGVQQPAGSEVERRGRKPAGTDFVNSNNKQGGVRCRFALWDELCQANMMRFGTAGWLQHAQGDARRRGHQALGPGRPGAGCGTAWRGWAGRDFVQLPASAACPAPAGGCLAASSVHRALGLLVGQPIGLSICPQASCSPHPHPPPARRGSARCGSGTAAACRPSCLLWTRLTWTRWRRPRRSCTRC